MAKGVKKIKWNGTGQVYRQLSVPDSTVVIAPDQWVYFVIGEWFSGTSETEKKKVITWIRQSGDKKIEFHKENIPAKGAYGFQIAKKQCGSYRFYLEATLSGIKDIKNNTGLLIGGFCEPDVISSSWAVDKPGNDDQITSGNPTIYGLPLKLHLETHGLNGDICAIEVYNTSFGALTLMKKTYTAKCVNGEVELHIPAVDTLAWSNQLGLKKQPKAHFFIKIKGRSGKYVVDSKQQDKHATHLYINNKVGQLVTQVMPVKTSTPAKTGQQAQSFVMYGCKFESINITDRGQGNIVFSDVEKGKLRFGSSLPKFKFGVKIMYDTDQSEIRKDAKPIMDNLVSFLKANPKIPLLIESYADIRKDHEYNMNLTERRANGILSYLNTHGVKNKMTTAWYGESKAKQFKYETKEDTPIHRLNRRTELTFFTPNLSAIFYNTIVPTIEQPTVLDIRVGNFNIKNCMLAKDPAKKHDDKKANYMELTNDGHVRGVVKDLDIKGGHVSMPVFSDIAPMLPIILPPLRTITPNRFFLGIHSCNYFPDKTQPTIIVNAFPDALWLFHASYDYEESYFFKKEGKPQQVAIVKGIETLYSKVEEYLGMYLSAMKFIPMFTVTAYAQEFLINYIREESKMYGVGYHKRWNWPGGAHDGFGKEVDYTQEHRIITEIAILTLTILVIIVEILIAFLTGGESAVAKLPKLKKAARFLKEVKAAKDKIEDLGFEIIFPKVALNRGIYFKKGSDGNIYYIIEDNVSAKPLLAIKYEKDLKLADLLAVIRKNKNTAKAKARGKDIADVKSASSEDIQKLLDKIGIDAKLNLKFEGRIEASYQAKFAIPMTANTGGKKITVLNLLNSALSNSSGEVIGEDTIKAKVHLEAKGKAVLMVYKPLRNFIPPIQLKASIKTSLEGYITHKRTYGIDVERGPYYKDQIYFSGIKGIISGKFEVAVSDQAIYDSNPDDDQTEYVLFEPQIIEVANVQLY